MAFMITARAANARRCRPPSQRDGSPHNAFERSVNDGDEIRIYNQRGGMHARARVTDDVPPDTVGIRDGWLGLNTDGRRRGDPG